MPWRQYACSYGKTEHSWKSGGSCIQMSSSVQSDPSFRSVITFEVSSYIHSWRMRPRCWEIQLAMLKTLSQVSFLPLLLLRLLSPCAALADPVRSPVPWAAFFRPAAIPLWRPCLLWGAASLPLSNLSHIPPKLLCSALGSKNGLDYKCLLRQARPPDEEARRGLGSVWGGTLRRAGHARNSPQLLSLD